jgi:hypothetical protein
MQTTTSTSQATVQVIPAGGRFKMRYTRSGRHYEEPLEKALEELNAMLFFGPEVKLQQTDIRLVALNRRTYATLEEIHNLHRAQASDIERFVLRFAVGQAASSVPAPDARPKADHPPEIEGFKVLGRKGSAFPILVFMMSDGREDDQHLLTNGTIRKLRETGIFDQAFDIRLSPTNDTLMAYRNGVADHDPVETVPVGSQSSATDADGEAARQRAQQFLNKYCRKIAGAGLDGRAVAPALDGPSPEPAPVSAAPLPPPEIAPPAPPPASQAGNA